jgi:misacylated tRNA(Ala) deacylase
MIPSNAYESNAYAREVRTTVLTVADAGIVLADTVFYPLGGGQPGDTGRLVTPDGREARITDTRKGEPGRPVHVPAAPHALEPGDAVTASLDWERRYAHMRMHTCLHLLGSILRYGVTGGQVGADRSRLDFDTQEEIDRPTVSAGLNALIEADHEVRSAWITAEELDRQPELIRTMSVKPPAGAGRIRLLEIVTVDLQPCGGTHVRRTGEIGPVEVIKIESKGRRNKRVQIGWA